jgi:tRNA modification GTPase
MGDVDKKDTIAAVSTPPGQGGIGIVRISGNESFGILERIFKPAGNAAIVDFKSHTIHYGQIVDPDTGMPVDEVLVNVMKQPNTYTREDTVEINCHGGQAPVKNVLRVCLTGGARLAEPGEFTKRAFLSGRLDLSQAEAVLDIISSSSDAACETALKHLRGDFSKKIKRLREGLLDILSGIELGIDFSQEDVEAVGAEDILSGIKKISGNLQNILSTADNGIVIRNGASIVICGRPNVGKSSLMNALLRHERVIVTPVAGTTRDIIEESIELDGVRMDISDTAGIIETTDRVELEGIIRSKEKLKNADIVIFVLDASRDLSDKDKEIYETVKRKKVVIAVNKIDLKRKLNMRDVSRIFHKKAVKISALEKRGLDKLENEIRENLFNGEKFHRGEAMVNSLRHKILLEKALSSLRRTLESRAETFNGELAASDINEAVQNLGLITGESVEDDVLDRIFSRFCIGK